MSWREILGVAPSTDPPYTQYPHNAQKNPNPSNCADSAESAYKGSEEDHSRLLEALTEICRGLSITPKEVQEALAPEDIEDWRNGDISHETLAAFVRSLVQHREMAQGNRPAHYTEEAICRHCGPIWLWFSGEVEGLPLVLEQDGREAGTTPSSCHHRRPLIRVIFQMIS